MEASRSTDVQTTFYRRYGFLHARTIVAIGLLAAFLSLGFALRQHRSSDSRFPLEIDPQQLDLGRVWERADIPWTLHVRNTSNKPVAVDRVATSCYCTSVSPQRFDLQPGCSTSLNLTLNLEGRSSPGGHAAPFAVLLTPFLRSQIAVPVTWELRGEIVSAIDQPPIAIDFGELIDGELPGPQESTLVLHNAQDTLVLVDGLEWASITTKQANLDPKTWFVRLLPNKPPPLGSLSSPVRMKILSATKDEKGVASIPLIGKVTPDIIVEPSPLTFGVLRPGETSNTSLTVRSKSGTPFGVTEARAPSSELLVRPIPTDGDAEYRFALSYIAPDKPGQHNVSLIIAIENADGTMAEIVFWAHAFVGVGSDR